MDRKPGTVYLLHFDRPYGPGGGANGRGTAKHYLGWAKDLQRRLAHHAAGTGARLTQVVADAGIGWTLARTWEGDRHRERQLKQQGGRARLCPVCKDARKTAKEAGKPMDFQLDTGQGATSVEVAAGSSGSEPAVAEVEAGSGGSGPAVLNLGLPRAKDHEVELEAGG